MNILTTTTIERGKIDQTKTSKANPISPVYSLNASDSFTQCLKEARKKNLKINESVQESNEESDLAHAVEDDSYPRMKNIEGKQLKTKMKLESRGNTKSECDLEFEKENSKFRKLKENSLDESVNIPNVVTSISGRTSLPLECCRETNITPTAISTSANKFDKNESILKVDGKSSSATAKSLNQKKEPFILNSDNNSSKKRRLYSSENNKNVKDLVMSSQEDLSLEVPKYKITNREHRAKPQLEVSRANISYSYITEKEKGKEVVSSNNKMFSDCYDLVENVLNEEITKCPGTVNSFRSKDEVSNFKKDAINDKKLRALNKTPESTKASKIFKSHSVYSDLSSPDKKKPVKRTYTRPKRQKRFKKIQVLDDSSDSEYEPPSKISSEYIEPKGKKTRSSIPAFKGFVDRLQNERIDPIRDHTHTDEMEIRPVCVEDDEMENTNLTMHVHALQLATTTISKVCKRKKKDPVKAENVKAPKKPVNRKTRAAQSKKPEVQTSQDAVENMPGEMAVEPPLLFGSANCK